jgi:acyl-CoA synthetase (NDP forming)
MFNQVTNNLLSIRHVPSFFYQVLVCSHALIFSSQQPSTVVPFIVLFACNSQPRNDTINFVERRALPLAELFSPRGVAVVGAFPAEKYSFARQVVESLKEAGFPAIYPVNPKYTELLGLKCYPDLKAIPGIVDHVIVSIPAESALALLDDCAAKAVRSVHFFTAGFSESGQSERAELENAMLTKARDGGFRIIGPNCIGLFVPKSRLVTTAGMPLEPGAIAFVSQGGNLAQNLPLYGGPRGLRFSKVVSYGNALDVDESELLQYLSKDPETEIIAAYIENVKDEKRFKDALKQVATRKPMVICKGGTTETGKRAAQSDTASMLSPVAVFSALCRQMRIIQVSDIDELIDVLVALHFATPLPRGYDIAVVGQGGGPSVLAGDEIERAGLNLPCLPPQIQAKLKKFLPIVGGIFGNPVDATNLLSPDAIFNTMRVLGKVPSIHMLLYHLGFHPVSRWGQGRLSSAAFLQPAIKALTNAHRETGKPVLLVLHPASNLDRIEDFLGAEEGFAAAGLPVFHSLYHAAIAMARVVSWNQA